MSEGLDARLSVRRNHQELFDIADVLVPMLERLYLVAEGPPTRGAFLGMLNNAASKTRELLSSVVLLCLEERAMSAAILDRALLELATNAKWVQRDIEARLPACLYKTYREKDYTLKKQEDATGRRLPSRAEVGEALRFLREKYPSCRKTASTRTEDKMEQIDEGKAYVLYRFLSGLLHSEWEGLTFPLQGSPAPRADQQGTRNIDSIDRVLWSACFCACGLLEVIRDNSLQGRFPSDRLSGIIEQLHNWASERFGTP